MTMSTRTDRSPGELFANALRDAGLGKTEFGRLIGAPYYKVHRWTQDREFTKQNRIKAAEGLGLAPDAFGGVDWAADRELERVRAFHAFLRRPLARQLTPETRRILESVRFRDRLPRPSVALYEAIALALLGQIDARDVSDLADYNDAIDRTRTRKAR